MTLIELRPGRMRVWRDDAAIDRPDLRWVVDCGSCDELWLAGDFPQALDTAVRHAAQCPELRFDRLREDLAVLGAVMSFEVEEALTKQAGRVVEAANAKAQKRSSAMYKRMAMFWGGAAQARQEDAAGLLEVLERYSG